MSYDCAQTRTSLSSLNALHCACAFSKRGSRRPVPIARVIDVLIRSVRTHESTLLCADGLNESRFPIGFTARDLTRDPFLVYAHDVTPAIEREDVFDEIAVLVLARASEFQWPMSRKCCPPSTSVNVFSPDGCSTTISNLYGNAAHVPSSSFGTLLSRPGGTSQSHHRTRV